MRDDLDIDNRELCPDGACIGVIGTDGRCKVCGTAGAGTATPFRTAADPHAEKADHDDHEDDDEVEAVAAAGGTVDDDWDRRRLCRDGRCIGVIGPDGNCKVCGTRA